MNQGRRPMAYAVLLCAAGAALVFFATTRVWVVAVVDRPDPLPALRAGRTGADLLPWLPALALAGLAGAGAVLATRGAARRLVGGLLTGAGLAIAAGAGHRWAVGEAAGAGTVWLLVCLAGGVAVTVGGAATLARGRRWPTMGARYERGVARRPARDAPAPADARRTVEAWDALDRGEDPTTTGPAARDRDD